MNQVDQLLKKLKEGNCSLQELEHLRVVMKMPAYDNAVERAMYEHWMKCDNSPVGDDARFKHILSEVHHAINAGTTQKIFLSSFYKVFSKIAAILLIPLMIAFFVVLYQQYTKIGRASCRERV